MDKYDRWRREPVRAEEPVVAAFVAPAGVAKVAEPEPIQPVPQTKDEKCLAACKAIRTKKDAWQAKEDEIRQDRIIADALKEQYDTSRSRLGQDELDWARSNGWIGYI